MNLHSKEFQKNKTKNMNKTCNLTIALKQNTVIVLVKNFKIYLIILPICFKKFGLYNNFLLEKD